MICTYSEARWSQLRVAVESVRTQTLSPDQLLVVIDHNPALLERVARELPDVEVVANRDTRGLSGARNCGVREARGEVVAFLDDDAAAEANWLATLVAPYADSDVIGTGGMVLPRWPDTRPTWFPEEFDWVVGCTYRGLPEEGGPVRNLIGAAMSYRRCVFDKVGFFSADVGRVGTVPRGCEETEFGIRALRRFERARLLYVPTARVWHSVSAERTKLGYFTRRCFAEGMSKATVAGSTGVPSALSTEYRYTMRTLPRGVLRGLRAAIGADFGGLRRAGIIVVGLVVTTFGYLTGRVRARLASRALPGITDRGR